MYPLKILTILLEIIVNQIESCKGMSFGAYNFMRSHEHVINVGLSSCITPFTYYNNFQTFNTSKVK
jgi:hypothetical protein